MSARQQVQELLDFIDASPSPWHAVKTIEAQLATQVPLDSGSTKRQNGHYSRADAITWCATIRLSCCSYRTKTAAETGFKIIGAHTDSPGLRIKPNAASSTDGLARLGVEIYGGPILATFTDRDLSLAGRIAYKNDQDQIASMLVKFDQPLLRLPNLAIHMNRASMKTG